MKKIIKSLSRSALAAGLLTIFCAGLAQAQYSSGGSWSGGDSSNCSGDGDSRSGGSLRIIGLTNDQRLICFSEFSPGDASNIGTITGLGGADTSLIGIDFRVQDNNLYGVGNGGGIYTIDRSNAAATLVSQLTVPLNGTLFGVDFNPQANRLRIISDTGQNLRHKFADATPAATAVDGTLSYTAPAGATALGVTGAAYTNNDLDAVNTLTTLYVVDSTLDQVAIQSPANNGTLQGTGRLTVNTNASIGFDIYSTIRNNTTVNVEGFATLTSAADNTVRFYSVTLFNGKASSRGSFSNSNRVVDIAIPLGQR